MITDFYNLRPDELEPGMVFAVTITCHINYLGQPQLYRCPYPNAQIGEDGTPQGDRIFTNVDEVTQALFPVINWAEELRKEGLIK